MKSSLDKKEIKAIIMAQLVTSDGYDKLCQWFDTRIMDYTAGQESLERLLYKLIKTSEF